MKGKIAIEPALTNVRNYLTENGFDVVTMTGQSSNALRNYDAIVVTGLSTNLLGIEDTETKAVVINADGLSPEEVADRLNEIK
jgi:galactitol-specific phosphotransferase system IIB component